MIAPSTLTPELERMMRSEARMLDLDYDALGQAERHKLRVIARRRSLIMHEEGLDVDARVVLPPADDIDAALDRLAESTARLIALDAKTRRDPRSPADRPRRQDAPGPRRPQHERSRVVKPPRPTYRDVRPAAAAKLAPAVLKWADCEWPGIERRLVSAWDSDGYAFARNLEHECGIDPDAELVEILSGADEWSERTRAVKAWVIEHGIALNLQVGQRVTSRHGAGVIRERLEAEATYIVLPDAEADSPKFASGGGLILAAEDVQPEAVAA